MNRPDPGEGRPWPGRRCGRFVYGPTFAITGNDCRLPLQEPEIEFEVVRDTRALSGLRDDWQRLWFASAAQFYTLSFPAIWQIWTRVCEPAGHRLNVIVGRVDGAVVLLLPIMIRHDRIRRIWRVAVWLGREPVDYGDVLIDHSGDSTSRIRAALDHLARTAKVDVIMLDSVRGDAHVTAALKAYCTRWVPDEAAPYIELNGVDGWEHFETQLPKDFRKGLRRRARRLDEVGKLEYSFSRGADIIDETVRWITDRKREWIEHRGISKGHGLEANDVEAAIAILCEGVQSGNTLIARLTLDGTVIAADVSLISNGRLYSDIGSFDLKWGKYSPGSLLIREEIKWALDNGVKAFDFARGPDEYKFKWASGSEELGRYFHACGPIGMAYVLLRTSSVDRWLRSRIWRD